LLKAKEDAKKRMKETPTHENISAFSRARAAVSEETARLTSSSPLRVYRSQGEAVTMLKDAGYKVSKSSFSRAANQRLVSTNVEGHFEESALLAYANLHLTPLAKVEHRAQAEASASKISADAELKSVQAARFRLKLEQEQGRLMPRAEHERDLGARALFFKREVQTYVRLHGAAIIHLVGGEEDRLPDLVRFWEDTTEVWMDAWAREREFVLEDVDMDATGEDAPSDPDDAAGEAQ
jgi:hypothetical protein